MASPAPDLSPTPAPGGPRREAGLDVLRAGTTLLVVLHHTAITYGAQGGWFYVERRPDGSWPSLALTFFCTLNQAWFMGLFFLLAGYFTPPALARKGVRGFVADRLLRLGLPWAAFVLLLGPLTVALARITQGQALGSTLAALAGRLAFIPGPLWFAQALLLFSAAAALWWRWRGPRAWGRADAPFPALATLMAAALATGAAAWALRARWPVGVDVAGMQWGYFASYAVLFAAGCRAAGPRWLAHLPPVGVYQWRRVARWVLPVLPVVVLAGDVLPVLRGRPEGGWSVPAAVYAFWEPLLAWGVIGGLVATAQARWARPGRLWRALSRRAFAIFVIHPPVLVAVAVAWAPVAAPPLLKFALTGAMACIGSYALAGLLLRVRAVARVL